MELFSFLYSIEQRIAQKEKEKERKRKKTFFYYQGWVVFRIITSVAFNTTREAKRKKRANHLLLFVIDFWSDSGVLSWSMIEKTFVVLSSVVISRGKHIVSDSNWWRRNTVLSWRATLLVMTTMRKSSRKYNDSGRCVDREKRERENFWRRHEEEESSVP